MSCGGSYEKAETDTGPLIEGSEAVIDNQFTCTVLADAPTNAGSRVSPSRLGHGQVRWRIRVFAKRFPRVPLCSRRQVWLKARDGGGYQDRGML